MGQGPGFSLGYSVFCICNTLLGISNAKKEHWGGQQRYSAIECCSLFEGEEVKGMVRRVKEHDYDEDYISTEDVRIIKTYRTNGDIIRDTISVKTSCSERPMLPIYH